MDFNVFEETKDAIILDSKAQVTKPTQYRHVVEVEYKHRAMDNLTDASVRVDGVPFESLPSLRNATGPQNLAIVRSALEAQFGLRIPKKVVPQDTRNTGLQIAQSMVNKAGGW